MSINKHMYAISRNAALGNMRSQEIIIYGVVLNWYEVFENIGTSSSSPICIQRLESLKIPGGAK